MGCASHIESLVDALRCTSGLGSCHAEIPNAFFWGFISIFMVLQRWWVQSQSVLYHLLTSYSDVRIANIWRRNSGRTVHGPHRHNIRVLA